MKKVCLGLILSILLLGFTSVANACNFEGLYENYQAVYTPSSGTWSSGGMAEDRIVLTKKTSVGTGSYSEYYYSDGSLAASLNSNYEFLKEGMLIAVDNAKLKYSKVVYTDSKFEELPLTCEELKKIFPNAEIIKISQFKNNKITIKKGLFKEKTVLLVNDTDGYFHKFTFKPESVKKTDVKGLITLSKYGKVEFSHYGDNEGKLTIYVR